MINEPNTPARRILQMLKEHAEQCDEALNTAKVRYEVALGLFMRAQSALDLMEAKEAGEDAKFNRREIDGKPV